MAVVFTRGEGAEVLRRRRCSACGARYNTRELPEASPRLNLVLGLRLHPEILARGNQRLSRGEGVVLVRATEAELLELLCAAWPRVVGFPEMKRALYGSGPERSVNTLRGVCHRLGLGLRELGVCLVTLESGGHTLALVR